MTVLLSTLTTIYTALRSKLNDSTDGFDFLLSAARYKAGPDNNRTFGETTLAENLAETQTLSVDHRYNFALILFLHFVINESPQFVDIDDRAVELVQGFVVVTHTNLAEVTGMVFVHIDTMVVLATSKTAPTGVLPVFANTTMTSGDVSTFFSVVVQSGRLYQQKMRRQESACII